MAVEEQRLRIRQSLEESLGVEEASYLMDRPAGGWSDLVTNRSLDLRLLVVDGRIAGLERRMDGLDVRMDRLERSVADVREIAVTFVPHFEALRHELIAEVERRFRAQTWALVSMMLAAVSILGVLQRI